MNRVIQSSPLELLMGKVSRPLEVMLVDDVEQDLDLEELRSNAVTNIDKSSELRQARFDRQKAKIVTFSLGDYVLLMNE